MDARTDVFLYSGTYAHLIRQVEPEVLEDFADISAKWPVTFIYALIDPRDDRVRYIGCSGDPYARLSTHTRYTKRPEVREWILELRAIGEAPRIAILDQHRHLVMALHFENRAIAEYEGFHGGLLNRYKRYTKKPKPLPAYLANRDCAATLPSPSEALR